MNGGGEEAVGGDRRLAAIVLAGGRGSRLGGVHKGGLLLEGETLLGRALAALASLPLIVVGPGGAPGTRVVTVREDPPFGGPAAAVAAGLAALPSDIDEVLLLAVDVPGLPALVPLLLGATGAADGVVAVDDGGREQWLIGRYRVAAVLAAIDRLGEPTGRPVRALLQGLELARLHLPAELLRDVDTVADAQRAGVLVPHRTEAR